MDSAPQPDLLPAADPLSSLNRGKTQEPAAVTELPLRTLDDRELVREPGPATVPATRLTGFGGEATPPTVAPAAESPSCGTIAPLVPGYEILGELGRGGMGVVYKARQTKLKRLVALKMILSEKANPEALGRFLAEAEAVARLQHPNIVQIHEVGLVGGWPFFSLEYMEGGSLDKVLAGTPQPPRDSASLVRTLALAMQAAHDKNIVHRDLKPANILLAGALSDPSGSSLTAGARPPLARCILKVGDFGLAKQLDDVSNPTVTGAIMGTPNYMAPEQAEARTDDIGPATDVYALGAILYELLTGRPPFKGPTAWDTIEQVRVQEPVAPSRLAPGVPRDLETICLKCLQKSKTRRYARALELADDLQRYLDHQPIRGRRVGALERAVKWARRRPAVAALVGVSIAAILAGVTFVVGANVYLNTRLQEEKTRVEAFEQEKARRQRYAAARTDARTLLDRAAAARARKDWPAAREQFAAALAKLGDDAELGDLTREARAGHAWAERGQQARQRLRLFRAGQERALSYLTRFTGRDPSADRADTLAAVRAALTVFDVAPDADRGPLLDEPFYEPAERRRIITDCYELLLILTDAEAPAGRTTAAQARQALAILDRASLLVPATRAAHLRRARCWTALNEDVRAGQEEDRARAVKPSLAADFFLAGVAAHDRGDLSLAIREFGGALRLQPDHFWARYLQAICYLKLPSGPGHLHAARANLTAGMRDKPDYAWAYVYRGFAHGELREFSAAEQDYRTVFALLDKAPDPTAEYAANVNRGLMYLRQERLKEAVSDLRHATELQPKQYQAFVTLAQAYQKQGHSKAALAALDRALALRRLPALYSLRAGMYLQAKDEAAALRDLDEAVGPLAKGRNRAELARDQLDRARLLRGRGERARALKACAEAIAARPTEAAAYRLRGEMLLAQRKYKEAASAFDLFLKVNQTFKQGLPEASAHRARGVARAGQGKYAEAIEDYTRALQLEPDAATHVRRGWALVVSEALKLARHDFDRALELDPKKGEAYAGRGFCQVMAGDYRKGADDADEALKHGPADARLIYNCSRVLAQAAARAARDATLPEQRARSLRTRYEAAAGQRLAQALAGMAQGEAVAFWKSTIRIDAALNPIRKTAGFLDLARKYAPSPMN